MILEASRKDMRLGEANLNAYRSSNYSPKRIFSRLAGAFHLSKTADDKEKRLSMMTRVLLSSRRPAGCLEKPNS
jgi:hypothetical protein